MSNVDTGKGFFKGTVDVHKLLLGNMAQKWAKVTPFYAIVNRLLHSNFHIYMFYFLLLIYF